MMTTAGSLALEGSIATQDAFVVARLRAAGAVILGKTNLSEWANFRSTHSTSGWSGRGGQVKNPYALDRNPCGSSSGTGAAIAANLAAIGVGTETDGSIVCPSGANGLVGIKPTVGLVSRVRHHSDLAQPGHRRADGAHRRRRGGAARRDGRRRSGGSPRPSGAPSRRPRLHEVARCRRAEGRAHRRRAQAVLRLQRRRPIELIEAAIADMKAQGAVIVDPADIPTAAKMDDCEIEVLLYEFKADLNEYLQALGPAAPVHSLDGADRVQRAGDRHARCRSSARSCCCRPRRRGR